MDAHHVLQNYHGLGDYRLQDGHYRLAALDDDLYRRVCLLGDHDRLPDDHHGLNGHGYYGHARLAAGDDDLVMRYRQL
jgi:hypothetical protein